MGSLQGREFLLGGEDRVDENEGSGDFSTEARSLGVAGSDGVGTATESLVRRWLETLDDSETLHYHVVHFSGQRLSENQCSCPIACSPRNLSSTASNFLPQTAIQGLR